MNLKVIIQSESSLISKDNIWFHLSDAVKTSDYYDRDQVSDCQELGIERCLVVKEQYGVGGGWNFLW